MAKATLLWPSVTSPGPALGPQSPSCRGRQTHHEQLPPPPLLTMRTLRWFLFLPLCLSCGSAFMFSSLRDKAKEPQGKVPCGGHFRIRQNLPEHTQGWLGSKWLWLIFVVLLYVILKFRGDSEKNKVRKLRGASLRNGRQKQALQSVVRTAECPELEREGAPSDPGNLANSLPDVPSEDSSPQSPRDWDRRVDDLSNDSWFFL